MKNEAHVVLYQTKDGRTRLEVRFEGETVWLTQGQMVDLFQTTKQNVSLHIQNIFAERDLEENSVVKESLTTAADAKNYQPSQVEKDFEEAVKRLPQKRQPQRTQRSQRKKTP